ncbi:Protein GrpE (heat shock protein 70 (HSP70) cofactor) [Sulfurovum sp. enrichment culture clone C5]|uniref:Protein GrpE n=1 Tax=Sulfurovum sp. enrichment culture clone C5 TaxID=497650 RepID=A0A0S4XNR5_9BACT|nr:Protein GrpE (heat shock protein 70 (HSP70) cofactor) [Sulfurovum sp. enrichment culture clone C5]
MSQEEKETSEQINEAVECNESEKNNEIDELSKLQNEVQEYKDKYLRAYADFENTKKRLEKDKISAVAYANSSFAKDLLSVMDSFDGAMASIDIINADENSEVLEKIKEGISKTHEQLKKVLEKHGISEIECEGCFNPDVHQAIMQVEHEEKQSGEIVQILQKGYSMKDQVLRPAMVSTVK